MPAALGSVAAHPTFLSAHSPHGHLARCQSSSALHPHPTLAPHPCFSPLPRSQLLHLSPHIAVPTSLARCYDTHNGVTHRATVPCAKVNPGPYASSASIAHSVRLLPWSHPVMRYKLHNPESHARNALVAVAAWENAQAPSLAQAEPHASTCSACKQYLAPRHACVLKKGKTHTPHATVSGGHPAAPPGGRDCNCLHALTAVRKPHRAVTNIRKNQCSHSPSSSRVVTVRLKPLTQQSLDISRRAGLHYVPERMRIHTQIHAHTHTHTHTLTHTFHAPSHILFTKIQYLRTE